MQDWFSLLGAFVAVGFLAAPAADADADEADEPASQFEFSLSAAGFYGPASGFVQVPLGGEPGTTSEHRPTLRELGIEDAAFFDVTGRVRWGHFAVYAGYTALDMSNSGTLDESLISHGIPFAAGSPFDASIQLDVPYVGAGWDFDFDGGRLHLFPKIELALLSFSYKLDSPAASARRSYGAGAVRLGAEGSYQLGNGFALELDGAVSLPISDMPQIESVTGRVSYQLFSSRLARAKLQLGVAGRWIEFIDNQTIPNNTEVHMGPLVTGGFSVSF